MSLTRRPSLGAILLLALLVVALVGGEGGEEDEGGERGMRERGERVRERAEPDDGAERGASGERSGGAAGAPERGIVVRLLYVVDGDTIKVRFRGADESVRLIGVDTPEVDPSIGVECFGADASEFTERVLVGVGRVRLVFDAERRDFYDRLLAYVYAGPNERFVNAALVRRGFAETLTISPNDRFAALFDRLERAAARTGRGLWGAC